MKHLFLLLLLSSQLLFAQQKITVSGHITDELSGEDLMGVNIYLASNPKIGTVSNYYGFYSLSLPKGTYTLIFEFLSYEKQKKEIDLQKNIKLDIKLIPKNENLKEVVINASNQTRKLNTTAMGTHRLKIKEINNIPVLLGEKDIIKTIQLLPGVKPAGEGLAGYYVRGGNVDENLILLDQAPVYNASHVLGFFSIFNSDALRDAQLYKGHIPAKFGSRLSSVLDLRMKEGNNQKFHTQGGIGLISSRLSVEGPIVKDKSSFFISGRRTYVDLLMKAFSNEVDLDNSTFYFYDLNLKGNYRFNDNNRLFISGYFGRDVFGYQYDYNQATASSSFTWGNATLSLRYNHIFNQKLFSNTTLIFSNYDYDINLKRSGGNYPVFKFNLGSGIRDLAIKSDFNYYLNENNKINFGLDITNHTLTPNMSNGPAIENFDNQTYTFPKRYLFENALYVSNKQKINDKLNIYYGLRFTNFLHMGGATFTEYDKNGQIISQKDYKKTDIVKQFNVLSPRISISYQINKSSAVKSSFAKTNQFIHLMTSGTTSNPTDVWMPSGLNIPVQNSYEGSLGYYKNLKEGLLEFSTEIYYRKMDNVIDYKTGTQVSLSVEVEKDLLYGLGKAYGIEFLLRKKQGKLTGWVSYTLSRSLKQFDDINQGHWFPARQDRIHDISIVGNYKWTQRSEIGFAWVFYTGNATTFPAGFYTYRGARYPYFTERNGGRMPSYHRLDISYTLHNKPTKKYRTSWNFSLYNAYGRMNPYIIYFAQDYENDTQNLKAYQISFFRWVPSITYNFKF